MLGGTQAQGRACTATVARREEGVVDTGWHDLDALPHRAVQTLELRPLLGVGCQDHVAAADHVGLGAGPAHGFVLEVLRLHTRERVERRHERKLQLVLQRVARDTREPVVGMDQRGLFARTDPLAHTGGEVVDERR